MNLIEELDNFIQKTKVAQEQKRALAAKMAVLRKPSSEIQALLGVSREFVTKWKNKAIFEGVESLRLHYKGSKGDLSTEEKAEVIQWLQNQEDCQLDHLMGYIARQYNVVYASRKSDHELLDSAGMSWKKTQKVHPKKNEEEVEKKRQEIEEKMRGWEEEVEAGTLCVLAVDESHLLWGDIEGYRWGPTHKRLEIPIKNIRERQTYYGAIDYKTKEFLMKPYSTGDTRNTIAFVEYLRSQRPGQRWVLLWDGATYHRSDEFREYLSKVNENLSPEEWLITCIRFAPNAPEQNPVEEIGLQVKNFVRRFCHLCHSFKWVKFLFEYFAQGQIFEFPKLYKYAAWA